MLYRKPKEIETEIVLDDDIEIYDETFHCSIRPAIIIAQIFGLFPLNGISSKNPKDITFKWISLRTFFSFSSYFSSIIVLCLIFYQQVQLGPLTASNLVGVIFFGNCSFICLFFFGISHKWRTIIMKWTYMEKVFVTDRYKMPKKCWSMKKRIHICIYILLVCAFIEHFLFLVVEFMGVKHKNDFCNITNTSYVDDFIQKHLAHVFKIVPYNTFLGLLFEYFNFSYTFYWNFIDLFIMICSISLSYRFLQINERVSFFRGRIVSDRIWAEIRVDYTIICEFSNYVNTTIEKLIILAFFNDSYFILVQLLNITLERRFVIDKIYFWYSVILLIVRASFLFIFASDISENSRKIMDYLRYIPSAGWCQEIERLSNQALESNGFTGMNFFHISRPLLFGLAGTILTYELVLLQFDGEEIDFSITC